MKKLIEKALGNLFQNRSQLKIKQLDGFDFGNRRLTLLIGLVFLWTDSPQPRQIQFAQTKVEPVQRQTIEKMPLFNPYKVKERPSGKSHAANIRTEQCKPEPTPQNTTIAQTTPKQERGDTDRPNRKENKTTYPLYQQTENNHTKHTKRKAAGCLEWPWLQTLAIQKKVGLAVEAMVGYAT